LVFGADKSPELVLAGSGIAQSLIEYGAVSTMIQLACAGFLGLGSAGLITYLLFGITLNPLVLTAHGVIAGFLAFSLSAGDMRPPKGNRRSSGG
jgi:fatty acid desaturase